MSCYVTCLLRQTQVLQACVWTGFHLTSFSFRVYELLPGSMLVIKELAKMTPGYELPILVCFFPVAILANGFFGLFVSGRIEVESRVSQSIVHKVSWVSN